ncbi:MAG: hypothetical protein HLUCCO17_09670 [Saliniramus fredricksonii]|uniref:Uncharacterized protein n=1 Tax=Saliniramus fredricksonii TaxID=1653334 RepID=A0A0N8KE95_9HYPH|nr:hypothetical protein [Saliniramus fredricksonii]KPQ10714.1 MAG: hypothetical protein HLUCCO17_09670 [Saliniramus fredricksonii]SCC79581.1 hypothetical protein GA0071312_1004 [Saliniramus fredricksonii]
MSIDATAGMSASWATQPRDSASAAAQQVSSAQEARSERGGVETGPTEITPSREPAPSRISDEPARPAPPPGQGRNLDISV